MRPLHRLSSADSRDRLRGFSALGRLTSRHPWLVIGVWLLALLLSLGASLWGFGQGGLFQRMETSEHEIPGSESAQVISLTTGKDGGQPVILVVSGVPDGDTAEQVAGDNRALLQAPGVAEVIDPFWVREERAAAERDAEEKIQATIDEQVAQAMEPIKAEADAQAAPAKAAIEEQVGAAAALGPQAEAVAQEEADAALAQIDAEAKSSLDAAQQQVTSEVEEAVRAAADTPEARELRQEAADQEAGLFPATGDGYAVVVTPESADAGSSGSADSSPAEEVDLDQAIQDYEAAVQTAYPSARVHELSNDAVASTITGQIQQDLVKGEAFGLPVAALLMLIVFGGALAAGLPLVGAVSAISAGMGVLWVSTWVTTIDAFILNVVSIIGLSLSIDYGLLVVSRFREEGAGRLSNASSSQELAGARAETATRMRTAPRARVRRRVVEPAVEATVASAGRTVVFSAVTIALALSGIFFINVGMLRTIAWGGILVALLAVLAAVTLVPALLTLLGDRLLRPSPLARVPGLGALMRAVGDSSSDHGFFSRLAHWVQRRPWPVILATSALLLLMAAPVRDLEMRNNLTDYLPAGSSAEIAYHTVQDQYPELATPAIQVVVDAPLGSSAERDYQEATGQLEHVESLTAAELDGPGGDADMTLLDIHVDAADQVGPEVTQLVRDLRDLDSGATAWVGGSAAIQLDFGHTVASGMPAALAVVALAVMVLLFLMTGSLLVPLKALIINGLSVIASLGMTVAIFRHGWLGVTPTPGLETFVVVCMVAFGFGLAMDYEVFLLGRIKEFWDAGMSNDQAVAAGLQRSGRIITSAAAIMIAVFMGFALGEMLAIKQLGIGLAVMVLTDATVTRMLLVPATMTVMGKWNWWAPRPLARLAARVGVRH